MICIQCMMIQLTRERPVPESRPVWPCPFWRSGDDQGLFNFFTPDWETAFVISALLLTYLLSPTQAQQVHPSVHWQRGIASASEIVLNKFTTHSYTCIPLRPVFFFIRFSLSVLQEVFRHSKCVTRKSAMWLRFCHWNTRIFMQSHTAADTVVRLNLSTSRSLHQR